MAKLAGGYAEYAKVDARLVLPVPDSVSWEDAAASVLAISSWSLFSAARFRASKYQVQASALAVVS